MDNVKYFLAKYKWDLLAFFLILLSLPFFFYKLGQSSLVSWDEAWYGEIARNILKSKDPFHLTWNGRAYFDHPPVGFWIIALSLKLFGVNEFGARFGSGFFGLLSLVATYFLAKELFNRLVGFVSAAALLSCYWFLYRARSGDLDIFLTFFFILTFLLALWSLKKPFCLILTAVSLALLFLTKSLVPFAIIPALAVICYKTNLSKLKYKYLSLSIFLLITLSWFVQQLIINQSFLSHYLNIGFPEVSLRSSFLDNINLFQQYLHYGVGKWFWPGVLSITAGLLLGQKRFLILSVFFFTFALPFVFSHKGQIWHLIPLFPILTIAFFGFAYVLLEKVVKIKIVIACFLLAVCFYVSFLQIKRSWREYIDVQGYVSDEQILSQASSLYPGVLYLDDDFLPAAVFYSGKKVIIVNDDIGQILNSSNPSTIITHQWRLDKMGIKKDKYRIIKANRDKILISNI